MEECGYHGLQTIVVSPLGVLVQHPDEDWQMLGVSPDPGLNHASERGHCFGVLGREDPWPQGLVQAGVQLVGGRHPVGLAGIEFEGVQPGGSFELNQAILTEKGTRSL